MALIWDVTVRKTLGQGAQSFDLDVAFQSAAQRLALLGPSGAGKSLTLRALAGLLRPERGCIRIAGHTVFNAESSVDLPARARQLGYVFQDYALFTHLTVRQNLAFGLTKGWRNPSRHQRSDAVDHWLNVFELATQADRFPDELSGGQRQRTALARALVAQPRALLLDEPFAALDAPLRHKLRAELLDLQQRTGVPMLLITHDEADVTAFAEEVVCLVAGRVQPGAAGRGQQV